MSIEIAKSPRWREHQTHLMLSKVKPALFTKRLNAFRLRMGHMPSSFMETTKMVK